MESCGRRRVGGPISYAAVIAAAFGVWIGYELVRGLIVGLFRSWMRRGATRFVRQNRVRLEAARFIDRMWMRERLAWDPQIEQAILQSSQRTGQAIPALRERVDAYVDEIAPYFSMAAYYQLGGAIARRFVDFCFELVVDHEGFEAQEKKIPEGAVRVYVLNHRSNVDPLVISFALIHRVALSYAVGEWALVWPLSALFRSFGGYFVRRGETDPLYHAVLERFVQLLVGQGAVTGFFLEGALSRDGALRRARTGLLEYLIKMRAEHPDREIVFLPIGLNYDRVLEDRYLVAERNGRPPRPMLIVRLWNLVAIAFWAPILIAANVFKVATRSHRKFGYAAICFGEPLRLTDFPGGAEVHRVPTGQRKQIVKALAAELLDGRIGKAVPAVPVSITCTALLRDGEHDAASLIARIAIVIAELRERKAPIGMGTAFASILERRKREAAERTADLHDNLLASEEAELVLMLSEPQLVRRLVVRRLRGKYEIMDRPVVEYYANSIRHHWGVPSSSAGRSVTEGVESAEA